MDFLEEELEEILNIFRQESEEHIQNINQNLLMLEKNPDDFDVISELFREAHSIKGSARMIGLIDIQTLAHKLEDILGYAKDQSLRITPEIVDTLCKTIDCISSIVDESVRTKGEFHSPETDIIVSELAKIEQNMFDQDVEQINNVPNISKEQSPGMETKIIIEKIIKFIPNLIQPLNKIKQTPTNQDFICDFQRVVDSIHCEIIDFDNKKVKNDVINIKSKIDWSLKGSGILTPLEVGEIEQGVIDFIQKIKDISINLEIDADVIVSTLSELVKAKIAEDAKIEKSEKLLEIDEIEVQESSFYNIGKQSEETQIEKTTSIPSEENKENTIFENDLIRIIFHDIDKLHDKEKIENAANDILNNVSKISYNTKNADIEQILSKFSESISYIKDTALATDVEILSVLKQSIEYVEQIMNSGKSEEDISLILQRLSILQQMLELSEENESDASQGYLAEVPQHEVVPKNQQQDPILSQRPTDSGAIKTLRVDTKKLDQLVNQVGELIVSKIKTKEHITEIEKISRGVEDWYRSWNKAKQYFKYADKKGFRDLDQLQNNPIAVQQKNIYSVFEETTENFSDLITKINALHRTVQEDDTRLDLIVNELEQMVKSIRVLPLATIFHMFPRMVRDISRDKGKQVELILSGSETSADKKVIEEIKSPLTHIIRNAIDHGIEFPEERIKNGKNPQGKIFLSAYHLENSVLIEIIDDGKGIDVEKIKHKVLQKGLLNEEELSAMNDNQIMNIIFWPGFSTGDTVTDISGRGIGLDVVHTKISQLNGKVHIKSKPSEGCKVSIQLPVTMATIKSFLVEVNAQTFAIPTNSIKTAMWVKPSEIFYKEGKKTIIVNDKTIPVFKLSDILEMKDNSGEDEPEKYVIVVIQLEDTQVGFIIDRLLGDHEILHKNLSPPLVRVRNIAGITTLGSGELCLILNINDLIKSALRQGELAPRETSVVKDIKSEKEYNILVVDDSMTTRILERNILRAAGYNVSVAVNGLDALTKLNTEKYELIVSDVEMPEMTGIELVKRLRADKTYKKVPIILVTSLSKEKDKNAGLEAGADAYIEKGKFNQQELLSKVKELLT